MEDLIKELDDIVTGKATAPAGPVHVVGRETLLRVIETLRGGSPGAEELKLEVTLEVPAELMADAKFRDTIATLLRFRVAALAVHYGAKVKEFEVK